MKNFITCLLLVLASCNNAFTPPITPVTKGLADKLDVGASAHDLLSSVKYTRLNLEIQFSPGMRPQDRSVNNLVTFFKTYTNKPGGITVTLKQVGSAGKTRITTQDADSFAIKNRVLYSAGDLLSLYIYFADAVSAKSWIGGVAYRNTSLLVFQRTLVENTKAGGADRIKMETSVLEHEAGHLLGLVNNGTPMITPHEDAANRFHCTNRNCLMYHAVEGGLIKMPDNLLPVLDANCLQDLKTNRD